MGIVVVSGLEEVEIRAHGGVPERVESMGRPAAHILITDNTVAHESAQQIKTLREQAEAERVAFAERIKNNLLQANAELEKQVT
jgi:hypothetical protein